MIPSYMVWTLHTVQTLAVSFFAGQCIEYSVTANGLASVVITFYVCTRTQKVGYTPSMFGVCRTNLPEFHLEQKCNKCKV